MTTDTADLKKLEDALAEDTAALEDTSQDCQTKAAEFEAYTKSLSEELEVLAKAKSVILEEMGDAEYRDNRSVLPSHGGLVRELTKSEHSIELVQLTFHVASAMGRIKKESEPPYKTASRDDIVMMIDGETFCVPEEDVPKEY